MLNFNLFALTSYEVLAGLASIYLGLIICWGSYWLFFGISEKRRESQLLSLRGQIYHQQKENAAIHLELSATTDAFVTSKNRLESLRLEVTDLQHRLDQLESAQFELEELTAAKSTEHSVAPVPEPTLSLYATVEVSTTTIDPELGLVYTEEPAEADELTLIWGIGGVNQQKLREHGVYFFEQIANWTSENAHAFNAILGFKGRIEREEWVSQAARLAESAGENQAAAA